MLLLGGGTRQLRDKKMSYCDDDDERDVDCERRRRSLHNRSPTYTQGKLLTNQSFPANGFTTYIMAL